MDFMLTGTPNPRQAEFFLADNRHICYGGARGGGKSWAMRRKFVLLALRYEGLRLIILRRTMPELRENITIPLQREISGLAQYKESEKVFIFPNGSRLKLGYCDSENDVYQYQGQEYDVIGLEEATNFTETQMQFLTTCNRTTRPDFTPRMYYTCNPGGVGHAWVKRLFIDREYNPGEDPDSYTFIPARVWDNDVLIKNDPNYVKSLQALPEERRRAYLDGDWDVLAGQYFTEWRRDKHVCDPFQIPAEWRKYRAMDWGYNDPCCVLWFAIGPDKRIYVYDEYYQRERLAVDVCKTIKKQTGTNKIAYTAASPDMWQKRGTEIKTRDARFVGESIAEVFATGGVPLMKADNSRILGWQRVREYLRDAPDGKPYLQVFATCTNLIKYLPIMQYDQNNREDMADGEDHAPEALRYGVMTRPTPAKSTSRKNNIRPYDPLAVPKKTVSGFLNI